MSPTDRRRKTAGLSRRTFLGGAARAAYAPAMSPGPMARPGSASGIARHPKGLRAPLRTFPPWESETRGADLP
jgi:hypothetical protein